MKEHLREIVQTRWNAGRKVRIESIGFYYDTATLGSFLWSLSRENGGSFVGMNKP